MEFNLESFQESLNANPELASKIVPLVSGTEPFTKSVSDAAQSLFEEKISQETSTIHSRYDSDMFEALGEKAGVNPDGSKQKTYDKMKELFTELGSYRKQKEELNADTRVIDLQAQIEELKANGGGKHVQEVFDKAKANWEEERASLLGKIEEVNSTMVSGKKKSIVNNAVSSLDIDNSIPESIREMVINNAMNMLLENSKIEGDKIVFLDANGTPELDKQTSEPKTALQMLEGLDVIKQITTKEQQRGGGAAASIDTIQTTTIDGNDVKTLSMSKPATQVEFYEKADAILLEKGITRDNPEFVKIKDATYKALEIGKLPTN